MLKFYEGIAISTSPPSQVKNERSLNGRDSSGCMIKILPRIQSVYNNNLFCNERNVSAFFEQINRHDV